MHYFYIASSIFRKYANWTVIVVSMRSNAEQNKYTDIELYLLPNNSKPFSGKEILEQTDQNPDLIAALHKYGFVNSKVRQL